VKKSESVIRYLRAVNSKSTTISAFRSIRETNLATSVWLFLLLLIALPQGLHTKIGKIGLPNNSTAEAIRKAWGPGDAGSLLDTAITWANLQPLKQSQYWIVHLWTPGMSIIEVPLIWIAKLGLPIFWSLLLMTVGLWSTVFWLTWRYISSIIGRLPVFFVSLSLIFSWDFKYLFRDDLFYTEGLAFGLLMLGLGCLGWFMLQARTELKVPVIAGISIGISVMVRHVTDYGLNLLFAASTMLFLYQISKLRTSSRQLQKKQSRKLRRTPRMLSQIRKLDSFKSVVVSSVALLVTLPWRLISPIVFGGWWWILSTAGAGVGIGTWTPNSKIGFWAPYGMNWACNIDPQKCEYLYRLPQTPANESLLLKQAIFTALQHPITYLKIRGNSLADNWIPGGSKLDLSIQTLASLSPIVLVLIAIIILIRDQSLFRYAWIWFPFLIMEIGQLLLVHYESRYFIPVRLLMIGIFFQVLMARARLQHKSIDPVQP